MYTILQEQINLFVSLEQGTEELSKVRMLCTSQHKDVHDKHGL